ncbi:hypothetical protein [Dubosiella newyorkensis]|uniref:hypothetical protein n=1 Tax=Dubosiella newyorkensis TaxID=1862672 RepID=UPI00272E3E3A|nr:hypothetical protein [Dubosiella newyorkensis]
MNDYAFMVRVNEDIQKSLKEKAMIEIQNEALKAHRKVQIITAVIGAALILLTFMLETPH